LDDKFNTDNARGGVMGREKDKEIKNLDRVAIFGIVTTLLSVASLWVNGYIDAYYFKGGRGPMTIIFLLSTALAVSGVILNFIVLRKRSGRRRYIYIGLMLAAFVAAILEFMSAVLINFLGNY
jgi:hypothetical protein